MSAFGGTADIEVSGRDVCTKRTSQSNPAMSVFDAAGRPLFPEVMVEIDAIKKGAIAGHIFRRDHKHRRGATPLPWITARGDLDNLRSTVKKIVRAAKLRDELSFSSFRHGGFTEGADADLTDAELRAAGRHRSARQLPT